MGVRNEFDSGLRELPCDPGNNNGPLRPSSVSGSDDNTWSHKAKGLKPFIFKHF